MLQAIGLLQAAYTSSLRPPTLARATSSWASSGKPLLSRRYYGAFNALSSSCHGAVKALTSRLPAFLTSCGLLHAQAPLLMRY
jgi:hypothetical protein